MWKLVCTFACFLALSYGERIKDKMYQEITVTTPCFRRLNATHQTGCSSKRSGSTGVVHFVREKSDLLFILENGTAENYIPVMPVSLLTHDVIFLLKTSDLISGVAAYRVNNTIPDQYSHEDVCPNENSGLSNTCSNKWNLHGTGLLKEDLPFPMFYLTTDEDVENIRNCFNKFNNFSYETHSIRSLCSLELNSFMYATTDTPTCMRRSNIVTNFNPVKFCDPIGDENIWASLFPIANTSDVKIPYKKQKQIIIAARLDSTSLFLDIVPGAVNPVTSIVTLLTTAKLLKNMLKDYKEYDKNVLFVLFNGESYDYVGSQRLVYDMEKEEFPSLYNKDDEYPINPIQLEDIHLFIELNQLSFGNVHIFNYKQKVETSNFLVKLTKKEKSFFKYETVGTLPPSSFQSFLKVNDSIPGIVLADHGDVYSNKYYNSIYDNATAVGFVYNNDTRSISSKSIQWHIAKISQLLAGAVYEEITSEENQDDYNDVAVGLANELLNCYLVSANCNVNKAIQKAKMKDEPLSLYVSVSVTRNLVTYLTGLTLGWLTGDVVQEEPCAYGQKSHIYHYYNMSHDLEHLNKTVCFRTILNFTEAVSPAFIIKDYDWKSGMYSSWSESSWREINARLFLKPSSAHQTMTIAIGTIVFLLFLIVVPFCVNRSHVLFPPIVTVSPTSC